METGKPRATICIVNYKTEELTRLCLRSIRKFTNFPYRVIVVDNDSGDASLDYLRSLDWITLIERPGEVHKSGSWAHGTALDLGLEASDTEYFVAMHSDTVVHRSGWLEFLTSFLERDTQNVCSGSGKIDLKPKWQIILKKCTDVKEWLRKLNPDTPRRDFYIRAICACYRREVLMKENLRFAMSVDEGVTCGKQLYYDLLEKGYRTFPVQAHTMAGYIHHLAHATMVMNPEFTVRKRTEKKCVRSLNKLLNSKPIRDILNDSSLDK